MPELPEVESIRLQLEKFLLGHKIISLEVKDRRIFQGDEKEIIGAKFIKARRFGKVTVLDLDNNKSLMIHVKMTGQVIYRGPNLKKPLLSPKISGGLGGPHTHVIFTLDNDGKIYYNDFRKFGWFKIVDTKDVEKTDLVGKMGPEPFKNLTLEYFKNVLSKTRRPVKVVIMDQSKVAGVGNIYANDALYLSKINPARPANSLNENETKKLFDAIHEVLNEGMKHGGSSENTFVTPDGGEGGYQRHTLVYGKQGILCPVCKKEKIIKIMLGGRGTYYCPYCQPETKESKLF
ncbi:MAG TPA: bifunctional DNA-formamidopyrimidine glycosylase/DNA-(apurinic or apyrimidinic site) lyase [Patescibacteria group bacterium]|nr:bifunctional DNA-formamidopyrimidine glycosylase/DNA-(apurinic or apyrimidinic site) lyase [Patescibacteria group bacterium]